jgi:hypothetical protein
MMSTERDRSGRPVPGSVQSRWERLSPLAGVVAVALWIAGLAITDAPDTSTHKTDAQILAVYRHHSNAVLLGSWLFMLGCVFFLWFVGTLRGRMQEAEGGRATFSGIAFGGAVAATVFGVGTMAGPVAVVINKNHVSAATAGALTHTGDLFFVGAEITLVALFVAAGVVAFRTGLLPKWWAVLMWVVAVVLVIGPIGWAALIFGVPIWTLGTTFMLMRKGDDSAIVAPAAA